MYKNRDKTKAKKQLATTRYKNKFETCSVLLPKGTKDKIKTKNPNVSINKYINNLIIKDLKE